MTYKSFILLTILCFSGYSQNLSLIDSLQYEYKNSISIDKKSVAVINISKYYKDKNLDSLIYYTKKLKALNKLTNNKRNLFEEYFLTSFIEIQKKNDRIVFDKANKGIILAQELKDTSLLGFGYYYKSNIYHYYKKDYCQALKYKLKAESCFSKKDSFIDSRIINLSSISFIYSKFNNYKQALRYIKKAKNLLGNIGNPVAKGYLYNTLGILYSDLNHHDESIGFLKKGKLLFMKKNDAIGRLISEHNIAIANYNKGNIDISEMMFKSFLNDRKKYLYELNVNEERLIISKIYLARIAIKKSKYNKALRILKEIESVAEQIEYYHYLINIKIEKINIFYGTNKYNKALELINDIIKKINYNTEFLSELEYLYSIQSKIHESLQQTENELKSIKKQIEVEKKIDSINNNFNLESLKISFKLEKAQKEIFNQKRIIQTLKENDVIKSNNIKLILFSSFLILTTISFYFYKQKKINFYIKKNWEAEKKIKKLKETNLKIEIEAKKQQLIDISIHISEKNELLKKIKNQISKQDNNNNLSMKDLLLFINDDVKKNQEKYLLYNTIDKTKESFYKNLSIKYPELNEKEKKVASLIRLGYSSKQISLQMGIAKSSVNNYRYSLRKKLNLTRNQSLTEFINFF